MSGLERNWIRLRDDPRLRKTLEIRAKVMAGIRDFFGREDFLEIDPPILVPLPGMEPHLLAFSTILSDQSGRGRRFHLHTSPEYVMKKLLCAGLPRIYALCHVFRDGEVSVTHNPEFTLLEWYRSREDYRALMADCEALIVHLTKTLGMNLRIQYAEGVLDLTPPWPRIPLGDVMREHAGLNLERITSLDSLVEAARKKGYKEVSTSWPWEDIFYRIFLQEVEPRLPRDRPFFLTEYPVEMAALARSKPGAPRWSERFELYAGGLELANGFSELTDPGEQSKRLHEERCQRKAMGQTVYPVDVSFLEALERGMPDSTGIAMGVDRVIMLLADVAAIRDVLPFPADDLIQEWERAYGTEENRSQETGAKCEEQRERSE